MALIADDDKSLRALLAALEDRWEGVWRPNDDMALFYYNTGVKTCLYRLLIRACLGTLRSNI